MSRRSNWIDRINDKGNNYVTYLNEFYLSKVFVTGSVSALLSSFVLQPLDVVKTRLQSPELLNKDSSRYRILNVLLHIKNHENIRVLWAGTVPSLIRSIPGGGIYFTIYDWMKSSFYPNGHVTTIQSAQLGMLSRGLTDIAVVPLSVVKTRMESGVYKYPGFIVGLKEIYIHEGWRGLTSGLVPILARDMPMSGIYLMTYMNSVELVPYEVRQGHSDIVHFICAAFASTVGTFLTHPPDVIKTHLQLFPKKNKSTLAVTADIWIKYGILGFFQGILPRLMKRGVFAAISWTLYEKIKENNKK